MSDSNHHSHAAHRRAYASLRCATDSLLLALEGDPARREAHDKIARRHVEDAVLVLGCRMVPMRAESEASDSPVKEVLSLGDEHATVPEAA